MRCTRSVPEPASKRGPALPTRRCARCCLRECSKLMLVTVMTAFERLALTATVNSADGERPL
jgi:hypothetical protein